MEKYHPWQTNDLDCIKSVSSKDRIFKIQDNKSVIDMMGEIIDLLGSGYSVNLKNPKDSDNIFVDFFKWNEHITEEV